MKIPYLSKWGKRFRFYRGIQLKKAAVSCYKQLSEEGIHPSSRIVGENWDGGSYEVEMTY